MPQGNLLYTGYPYMWITQNQALQQAAHFKLTQKFKKIWKKILKYSVHIKNNSNFTLQLSLCFTMSF